MAALLHDVGKPETKTLIKGDFTFYNHEYVGERMTRKIMRRLKYSNEDVDRVTNLVRNHMFYYNVGEVTEASVRRLIVKVGKENLKDLAYASNSSFIFEERVSFFRVANFSLIDILDD